MNNNSRKILFLAQFNCQGAERMTLLYAKILHKAGFDCYLLLVGSIKENNTIAPFVPEWMPTNEIRYEKLRTGVSRILKHIRSNDYHTVFCSLPILGGFLCLFKFLRLTKSKVAVRLCNMPSALSKMGHLMCKYFYKYADLIISQTSEMKDEMIKYYGLTESSVLVINNPIDKDLINSCIAESCDIDQSNTNYIGVGKVIPRKGFNTLIKAFYIVKKGNDKSMLHIVGKFDDPECIEYKKQLDQLVTEFQLDGSVIFHGFQKNPFKYLNASDVFVLSSLDEGLPNVMLEAWYLGKPVVATSCIPYIKQVINDGVNGYSVPVDDEQSMAEAMLRATTLPKQHKYLDLHRSEELIINELKRL